MHPERLALGVLQDVAESPGCNEATADIPPSDEVTATAGGKYEGAWFAVDGSGRG
jgi:hypothetical protein